LQNSYNDSKDYLDFLVKNNVFITKEELGNRSLIDSNVLNHNLDWSMLNNTYNTFGYVVIDNFLNEEYILRLRDFVLYFNMRHDYYKDYAAINFTPNELWFPVLSNIVKETKEKLPFLSQLDIERAWAFIYNQTSYGVDIHADPGPTKNSANLNFWVTPNESVKQDTETNGLYIWDTAPPDDWDYYEKNFKPDEVREFLKSTGKEPVRINYGYNKAVIFNSLFYHKSQPVETLPGYENKRINYTFMFR